MITKRIVVVKDGEIKGIEVELPVVSRRMTERMALAAIRIATGSEMTRAWVSDGTTVMEFDMGQAQ